jgi:sulfur-oxidizing protein SoxZ
MLARIQVPAQAKRGEVIAVRIAIQHPMETGYRVDHFGRRIPRNVIHTLTVRFAGTEVFSADMGSGVAANPFLQFHVRAEASGEFSFDWVDDSGARGSERVALIVV